MVSQPVMPVFVAWNTRRWMPVGLGSFRRHFPSWQVLIIDNNPVVGEVRWHEDHEAERLWIQSQPGVIVVQNPGPSRTHGAAMDVAAEWCRRQQVEFLLHLEPDCLISGVRWYENLCRGIDSGAWMAGSHRKEYGPIHPTPSLWRVGEIRSSFDYANRLPDEEHPRFLELFRRDWLLNAITEAQQDTAFWRTTWDTGQRAWFDCAVADKAFHAESTDDFEHFWFGSDSHLTAQQLSQRPELKHFTECPAVSFRESQTGAPVGQFARSIGDLLVQALRNTGIRKAILAGCPRHANTGDLLLLSGQRSAILEAGIEIEETLSWPDMPSSTSDADAILLHGGGNFGDLYPEHMEFRMAFCRRFESRRIIWLPQSITYQCSQQAEVDMRQLAAFDNVEIWLRDGVSLAKAMSGELSRCRLVPDGIFGLRSTPAGLSAVESRLEIRRSDRESQPPHEPSDNDWMLPGSTMPHGENEAWDLAESRFRNVRMVVTDRLHVHLLCVLSDIPNVLVADGFGKNRAMFCTWTHLHDRSRFVSHWAQANEAETELTAWLGKESFS